MGQVQAQERGYHHLHGKQSAWSRPQLLAGGLPALTSPTSPGASPRKKTEAMGALVRNLTLRIHRKPVLTGASRRGNRGAGAGLGAGNYFLLYLLFKHLNFGLYGSIPITKKKQKCSQHHPQAPRTSRKTSRKSTCPLSIQPEPEQEREGREFLLRPSPWTPKKTVRVEGVGVCTRLNWSMGRGCQL